MTMFIYGLLCPVSGDLRYIGKSKNPELRFKKGHLGGARNPKNYKDRWIASLVRQGLSPKLQIICEIPDGVNWQDVERSYIDHARRSGFRITNTTAGGEGALITDPEVERKRIQKTTASWKNPELRLRQSEFLRNRATPEFRAAARLTMQAKWLDPEYAEKVSAAVKQAYSSDEARHSQSKRVLDANRNPETVLRRAKGISLAWGKNKVAHSLAIAESHARPEVKAKKSENMKRRHREDVGFQERHRLRMSDPEMIKRRNKAISAGHQRRKQRLREIQNANGGHGDQG